MTPKTLFKIGLVGVWIVAGLQPVFPLQGATLQSSWGFGFFFGLMFIAMSSTVIEQIVKLLYRAPGVERFFDKYFTDE